jgi:hypothetical protein
MRKDNRRQLYAVEARAREKELKPMQLLEQRQLHSVPVLKRIEAMLLANLHTVLPGSLLGKALHYMSAQWFKLSLYVTSGAYPIDNNACHAAGGMTGVHGVRKKRQASSCPAAINRTPCAPHRLRGHANAYAILIGWMCSRVALLDLCSTT